MNEPWPPKHVLELARTHNVTAVFQRKIKGGTFIGIDFRPKEKDPDQLEFKFEGGKMNGTR